MRKNLFFENLPMGLFLGYLTATILYLLMDENYLEPWSKYFVYSVSVAMTLFAAGLAWASAHRNINAQLDLEENRRLASLNASRAVLPLALSRFNAISERGIDFSIEDDTFFADSENIPIVIEALDIGDNTIEIMKQCIEYSDRETQQWISVLFANYQVARSRLLGSIGDPHRVVVDFTKARHAKDWAVVRALVGHLFEFARGSEESVPASLDLNTIRLPLLHPKFGQPIFEVAAAEIDRVRERFGDGNVTQFEMT